ncbi:MAG: hypothetical protein LUC37_02145 [Prevotella sp.]|nr:hypothetical protein [Prevotella sp.]
MLFTSLQTDYNEFGKNNFVFQVIFKTSTSEIEKEKNYYITYYRANVALYGYNAATILPAIDGITNSDALDILAALEFAAASLIKQIYKFYGIRKVKPYLTRAKAEYSQMSRNDRYLYYQIFRDSINYYKICAQKNYSVFI